MGLKHGGGRRSRTGGPRLKSDQNGIETKNIDIQKLIFETR